MKSTSANSSRKVHCIFQPMALALGTKQRLVVFFQHVLMTDAQIPALRTNQVLVLLSFFHELAELYPCPEKSAALLTLGTYYPAFNAVQRYVYPHLLPAIQTLQFSEARDVAPQQMFFLYFRPLFPKHPKQTQGKNQ